MLSISWGWKWIVYHELIYTNQTINIDKYCSLVENLKLAIPINQQELASRHDALLHHDNTIPHVSIIVRQKIFFMESFASFQLLSWHNPLQNSMSGMEFNSLEAIKTH